MNLSGRPSTMDGTAPCEGNVLIARPHQAAGRRDPEMLAHRLDLAYAQSERSRDIGIILSGERCVLDRLDKAEMLDLANVGRSYGRRNFRAWLSRSWMAFANHA